jgi:hypothetical protein
MRKVFRSALLVLAIAACLLAPATLADNKGRHAALKMCKQNYKNAVRGAKYLKGRDRKIRTEQARRDREECERLAGK